MDQCAEIVRRVGEERPKLRCVAAESSGSGGCKRLHADAVCHEWSYDDSADADAGLN